jgi:hypothetical protein
MPNEIVVFLGPTLKQERAAAFLEARYLPPAEQGALIWAVQSLTPSAIVLIDGIFAKAPAVRHKEILWTLSQGIPVFGAASMGALRAAELSIFGMIGYGLIYRWYRATPFADDDEVAVAMAPVELGACALSDALINMRLTLRRAERVGLIPLEMQRALEDLARSFHFIERTYANLFKRAKTVLPRWSYLIGSLEEFVGKHAVDQKERDTIGLLQILAALQGSLKIREVYRSFSFQLTEAWASDLEIAGFDINHITRNRNT